MDGNAGCNFSKESSDGLVRLIAFDITEYIVLHA